MWDNSFDHDEFLDEREIVKANGEIDMRVILQSALKIQAMHYDKAIRFTHSSDSVN